MTGSEGPARSHHASRGIRLSFTDGHAQLEPDPIIPGATILTIAGREQSHVNTQDPGRIHYAYLDRMRNGIDAHFPPGAPLTVAHIGAGALTLARALETSRPGSRHTAVDLEPRLLPFVLEGLPFPGDLTCVAADGLEWARGTDETFDLIVLDIFTGADSPEHLASADCYALLSSLLTERSASWPGGLLAVNIGDDPPLAFTARQLANLRAASPRERDVAFGTERDMLSRTVPGNTIGLLAPGGLRDGFAEDWAARGPHPAWAAQGLEIDRAFGF